jgi:hypothetical protein
VFVQIELVTLNVRGDKTIILVHWHWHRVLCVSPLVDLRGKIGRSLRYGISVPFTIGSSVVLLVLCYYILVYCWSSCIPITTHEITYSSYTWLQRHCNEILMFIVLGYTTTQFRILLDMWIYQQLRMASVTGKLICVICSYSTLHTSRSIRICLVMLLHEENIGIAVEFRCCRVMKVKWKVTQI